MRTGGQAWGSEEQMLREEKQPTLAAFDGDLKKWRKFKVPTRDKDTLRCVHFKINLELFPRGNPQLPLNSGVRVRESPSTQPSSIALWQLLSHD